jgi:hypothetical protein
MEKRKSNRLRRSMWLIRGLLSAAVPALAAAQAGVSYIRVTQGGPLDPVRDQATMPLVGSFHAPLAEEYIWTAGDAAVLEQIANLGRVKRDDWKAEPHRFRRTFHLDTVPRQATLYISGPRHARIWINGQLATEFNYKPLGHMGFCAQAESLARWLRAGENTIAIEAVRGYGSSHHTNSSMTKWLNSGEVLAVKIVPAAESVDAKPLLISNGEWRSSLEAPQGWEQPGFNDLAWKPVVHKGIESDADFYQWQADAGMYAWPGYMGEAPYMANYRMAPRKTTETPEGLVVDFGQELNGRVVLMADTTAVQATVRYAESLGELAENGFLGDAPMHVAAGGELRGPKTGFRYALVRFEGPHEGARIEVEGIVYPARELGRFTTNDERVNRIWETAAYTAHLCMQDAILDGVKRDRGLWIGDSEAIDRVVADVYGDARLVKKGLEDSIGAEPVKEHVSGLPSYSAWWVVAESEYVKRWGDLDQLRSMKTRLVELLALMEHELDARGIYAAAGGGKPFVDWAPDFSGDGAEARRATHFEYLLAFRRAAWMLELAGDKEDARKAEARSEAMTEAARKFLRDEDGGYGDRWQSNAIAVLAGAVTSDVERAAVWKVLARTVRGRKPADRITPYYGLYLLMAMAELGRREEALAWMKSYWGGMLDAGATSFWETWDPAYAGADPHAKMEADDKVGYYASLAHGWAAGPAAWTLEELAGIQPLAPGFARTQIRPDLAGLKSIGAAMPTPLGLVRVEAALDRVVVEIPAGMTGELLLPSGAWEQNGAKVHGEEAEHGERIRVLLTQAGRYEFDRK